MLVEAEHRSRFSGDITEFAEAEIQKHPVSRNQYPGSGSIANDFYRNPRNRENF